MSDARSRPADPATPAGRPTPSGTSYDDVPYESGSFPQTHPDRLATLARLFGLEPAPVDRCRVLELGCAMGSNLIPMAFNLPGSELIGVDASARQVAAARGSIAELGLDNVRVEHASILDVGEDWGQFDYIICHGVYSWVPQDVQEGILAVASRNLAPDGVALISYNTYPGWHMREMVRRMMRYHTAQFTDIPERIGQARALLDFLAGAIDADGSYGALLRDELQLVHRANDSYLFHEHLEEVNEPVYFHEFVDRAARHELRYLAEADFTTMLAGGFPDGTAETLARISPDIVRAEQYMDFLRNRMFRQTLLCHANHAVQRDLSGRDLRGFLLASPLTPESAGIDAGAFRTPDGRRVASAFPLTIAALHVLSEHWPLALDQTTLLALAAERAGASPALADEQWSTVLDDMLHCYASGAVELRTWQAPCTHVITSMPRISGLAAHQARSGSMVANQRHEPVTLDVIARHIAPRLDGTRDRAMIAADLLESVTSGTLTLGDDALDPEDESSRARFAASVDEALGTFLRRALLVG